MHQYQSRSIAHYFTASEIINIRDFTRIYEIYNNNGRRIARNEVDRPRKFSEGKC